MAKNEGLFKITGFIEGYSFYKRKGKLFVKRSSGHTGKRMKTDPAFANVRNVNKEFGGASRASKIVRSALVGELAMIAGRCNNQVTGLFQKVIAATEGERGRRPVKFLEKKHLLQGFQFGNKSSLKVDVRKVVARVENGIEVKWCPTHNVKFLLSSKSSATHARIVVMAMAFSDLIFDQDSEQYVPKNALWHGPSKVSYSDYISLDEEISHKQHSLILEGGNHLEEGDSILLCVGVIFYEKFREDYLFVYGGSCIGIEDVVGVYDI